MDFASDKHQKDLDRIKDNIRESYLYFEHNYKRFNEFRKMVFVSSLTERDRELLRALERPSLEFNILEAYVSRILGEIYRQQPAVTVNSNDPSKSNPQVIKFLEAHLRSIFEDLNSKHKIYEIAKDILSGGFSAAKVYTDYTSEMSMRQMIDFERAFDPTLCGWDPVTTLSHKGDGNYCFEIIPTKKEEVKEMYPKLKLDEFTYSRNVEGFKWSYRSNKDDMILLVDYYEKKKRKVKIVELSDGRIITADEWKKEEEQWQFHSMLASYHGVMPPSVVKQRMTMKETIVRYRMCERKVLEFEETDFKHLPIVFIDGNSILIRPTDGGNIRQETRPYVYHARGAQRLKNTAGIALTNEIESTVQHKFMIKEEALPEQKEYLQAWKQYQKPSLMVYKGFLDDNPEIPIPDPVTPVQRVGMPPEISNAFVGADSLVQTILGSYDAALGINDNQLSGVAIQQGAQQSNTAVMPYITGLMHGLQRIAQIYVSLVPKYYQTPITLPYVDDRGQRKYVQLQKQDNVLNYDDNVLNVVIEAGASFRVQKEQTLAMIQSLMGVSEQFAAFINAKGLDFILDNMEGNGIEQLKAMALQWEQQMQQQQTNQPNPAMIEQQNEQQKIQLEQQKVQLQAQDQQMQAHIEQMKLASEAQQQAIQLHVEEMRANTELKSQEDKKQLEEMKMQLAHINDMLKLKMEELRLLNDKEESEKNREGKKDEKSDI
jgi:hypothetical protein